MNDNQLKLLAGALLYALWAVLVWLLKLDPTELVGSIKYALGALGLYHAVTNLQGGQPQTLPAALMQLVGQQPKAGVQTIPLEKGPQ